MKKVLIAMSGGVDSSVAASLMQQQGWDCTAAELVCDFHNAVDDYLTLCEETHKEPERAYKGNFNVRISPELHKQAVIFAAAHNMSLNSFVEHSIQQAVHTR